MGDWRRPQRLLFQLRDAGLAEPEPGGQFGLAQTLVLARRQQQLPKLERGADVMLHVKSFMSFAFKRIVKLLLIKSQYQYYL